MAQAGVSLDDERGHRAAPEPTNQGSIDQGSTVQNLAMLAAFGSHRALDTHGPSLLKAFRR
jgi:hypothetical protein